MLRNVLFDMKLFDGEDDRENSQKRILWLLEALTRCNQLYLRNNPNTPLLYKSGVTYKLPEQFERNNMPEAVLARNWLSKANAPSNVRDAFENLAEQCGSGEHFRDIPRVIENGGGDCDNVAAWRAAELREKGFDVSPYITWRKRPDGGTTYHVIVRWNNDGSSEDPSLLLGMGGAEKAQERAEEQEKCAERIADFANALNATRRPVVRTVEEDPFEGIARRAYALRGLLG